MHDVTIGEDVKQRLLARRGRVHLYDSLEASRSAFVVIDMQNAFCAPGAPAEVPASRAIVDNINALAVDGPFGEVHRGFQAAMQDVWPKMRQTIRQYRREAELNGQPALPLWITGHSLGGAMAMLAAAREWAEHAD